MTVLIIYGGISVEHEVSVMSYRNIRNILTDIGYGTKGLYITKQGRFTYEGKSVCVIPGEGFFSEGRLIACDVILPLVHGSSGEDGKIQGLLELLDTPYISEGVFTSAAGMDKLRQTDLVKDHVPCLRTEKYTSPEGWTGKDCVIKPCSLGSSVGVHMIYESSERNLEDAYRDIRRYDPVPLIQPLVKNARELEMLALRDASADETVILGPVEIKKNRCFLSYHDKYSSGSTEVIPSDEVIITDAQRGLLEDHSRKVFALLGGEIYMRIDFLMDTDGDLFFNEVNTVPGMTETSHFITLAGEIGFEKLFRMLTDAAFERKQRNDALTRSYE
ncbi:MAG: hypothetical protein ACI4NM_05710 [Bullifex sp.]